MQTKCNLNALKMVAEATKNVRLKKMARKGKEADVQIFVKTEEEWEKILEPQVTLSDSHLLHCHAPFAPPTVQGVLTVVDVYSEWAGPCNAMANYLKKIKLEVGDELLQCAMANCDTVEALKMFRGHCKPIWLFIMSGERRMRVRLCTDPAQASQSRS